MTATTERTAQDYYAKNMVGTLIPSGTRANVPQLALEGVADATAVANLSNINGMMPVMSDIIFYDTRVFTNPLDRIFMKRDIPFGDYVEMAVFSGPAPSKKNSEDKCMPWGNVDVKTQFAMSNYAYDISIDIKDREINKAVFNEAQKNRYVAEKMKTPAKQMSVERYRAMIQILSDVCDMSRTIESHDSTDGTGTAVNYTMTSGEGAYGTIKGYVGKVQQFTNLTGSFPVSGSKVTLATNDSTEGVGYEVLNFINTIQSAVRDMAIDAVDYNKLGVSTFCMGKPYAIFESKTLDAMDAVLMQDGEWEGIPTKSAREWLSTFVDIVEIDAFAGLGDSVTYTNTENGTAQSPVSVDPTKYRIGVVILDKDACNEFITQQTLEASRCAKARSTGYNWQGEETFSVFKGVPSYCGLIATPNI